MTAGAAGSRIVLHNTLQERASPYDLPGDARAGLTSTPKTLPSKYFYDARGSHLFEAITRLPEYYLTRAETEILEAEASIFHDGPVNMIMLGLLLDGPDLRRAEGVDSEYHVEVFQNLHPASNGLVGYLQILTQAVDRER